MKRFQTSTRFICIFAILCMCISAANAQRLRSIPHPVAKKTDTTKQPESAPKKEEKQKKEENTEEAAPVSEKRKPLLKRIFGGGQDQEESAEKEEAEPKTTPGPPAPGVSPKKTVVKHSHDSTGELDQESVKQPPAKAVSKEKESSVPKDKEEKSDTKPESEKPSENSKENRDTPEEGLKMEDAPVFVEPETATPKPTPQPVASTEELMTKLHDLRKKAQEKETVQKASEAVEAATTEPEYYEARKKYLQLLYRTVRELDPEVSKIAETTEEISLKRLEKRRDAMRAAFDSGTKPQSGTD